MIRAIATIDDRQGIASPGHPPYNIPWELPADLQRFKALTVGQTVLMGRATYETLAQPLVERRNVVVSRSLSAVRDGFEVVSDPEVVLKQTQDAWVIGGAALYAATLDRCEELYLTHVIGDYSCDQFFPNYQSFELVEQSALYEQNGYQFQYEVYRRTKNR